MQRNKLKAQLKTLENSTNLLAQKTAALTKADKGGEPYKMHHVLAASIMGLMVGAYMQRTFYEV